MTVNRATSRVTAALTNTGTVGASFAVYPDNYLAFGATPVTVLPSAPRSYVWDATPGAGKYAFSVYGPDGFLTSFAGQVVPAGQNDGAVPVVTATLPSGPGRTAVELTLANEGQVAISYTLTPNDYQGRTQTVTVQASGATTVSWPADRDGYYDVVITAGTSDGFRRRYMPTVWPRAAASTSWGLSWLAVAAISSLLRRRREKARVPGVGNNGRDRLGRAVRHRRRA